MLTTKITSDKITKRSDFMAKITVDFNKTIGNIDKEEQRFLSKMSNTM